MTTETTGNGNRPYLYPKLWEWRDQQGNCTPGISLNYGKTLRAHMTPDEARAFADQLHDLADQLEERSTP
ncbi:DUF6907 domain-containing protein [Arthrobacter echini]|uniref:DUF6907 domain-containing protein n=1 Tax=Arthrobacter echini TaxID=1529066 RepID=UPI0026C593E6